MIRIIVSFFCALLIFNSCKNSQQQQCIPKERNKKLASIDSLGTSLGWPSELQIIGFAGPNLVPSPACIAAAATGEV